MYLPTFVYPGRKVSLAFRNRWKKNWKFGVDLTEDKGVCGLASI